MTKLDDIELLVNQVLGNGVSLVNMDGPVSEWIAIDAPVDEGFCHCGNTGIGTDPVSALRDLIKKQNERKQ